MLILVVLFFKKGGRGCLFPFSLNDPGLIIVLANMTAGRSEGQFCFGRLRDGSPEVCWGYSEFSVGGEQSAS